MTEAQYASSGSLFSVPKLWFIEFLVVNKACCYFVGYVETSNDSSQDSSNQGSLIMASMPATISTGFTNVMAPSAPSTTSPTALLDYDEVDVNANAEEELRQVLIQGLAESQSLSTNAPVPPSAGQAVLQRADKEMHDVAEQLNNGVTSLVVPTVAITLLHILRTCNDVAVQLVVRITTRISVAFDDG